MNNRGWTLNINRIGSRVSSPMVVAIVFLILSNLTGVATVSGQEHDETPMQLSGMSISQAFEIEDDLPLDLDEPLIKKLLYRIKKTSPKSRWNYSQFSSDLTWDDIALHTADHRLWIFNFRGRLKRVEKFRFSDVIADEEIKGLYICHCENPEGRPFIALARSLPRSIQIDQTIDQPIQVTGFLFTRASLPEKPDSLDVASGNLPVFIVDRLGWFPEKPEDTTTASHVELAKHGVDIGLLDFVRESNTQSLGTRDAEALYQMIAGVGNMESPLAGPRLGFSDLRKDSGKQIGNAIQIQGLVRQCSEIHVPTDIQQRIGLSVYYQLVLFPDLKGGKILIEDKSGDVQEFNGYPITVCCSELPLGMTAANVERKPFFVDGFFFRFWKFQSEKTDLAGKSGLAEPTDHCQISDPSKISSRPAEFCLADLRHCRDYWYRGFALDLSNLGSKTKDSRRIVVGLAAGQARFDRN